MNTSTPWQRAFEKFGITQNQFAIALDVHRSKISRALADERGLINGVDQARIIEAARKRGVVLTAADLLPVVK